MRGPWTSRELSLACAAGLSGLACFVVAVITAAEPNSPLFVGLMLGTMFGPVSLAAAWTALGPLPLVIRLPLAGLWLTAIWLAVTIGILWNNAQVPTCLVVGGAIMLQWVLVQLPIWLLVWICRLQIAHAADLSRMRASDQQFKIRQLLILTAIVAGLLGVARLSLARVGWEDANPNWHEFARVFAFLAVVNALLTLPLLAASLLSRWAVPACIGAILFALAPVAVEFPAMNLLARGNGPAFIWLLLAMNATQCAWVLGIVAILRFGGFRLVSVPGAAT